MRLTFRLLAPAVVLMVGGGLGLGGVQARGPDWSIDRPAPAGIGAAATGSFPDSGRRGDGPHGVGSAWDIDRHALASSGAEGTDGRTAPRDPDNIYAFLNRRGSRPSPSASRAYSYPAPPVYYYPAPPVYYYPAPPVYYYPAQNVYYYRR